MSYNTEYNVRIYSGQLPDFEEKMITQGFITLEKLITREVAADYGDPFEQACSWYDHEFHMKTFSLLHPDIVFELSGKGEESVDLWKKYFYNGKSKEIRPELVWPEFTIEEFTKDPWQETNNWTN